MARGLSDLQHFVLKQTAKQGVLFREEIKDGFFHGRGNAATVSTHRTLARLERRGLVNHQPGRKSREGVGRFKAIVLTDKGRNYVRERLGLKPKKLRKSEELWGEESVLYPIG